MNMMRSLLCAGVAACFVGQASASTLMIGQSTALDAASYLGPMPTGAYRDGAPFYTSGGFVWQNNSGYDADCQSRKGSSSAITLFALDNYYDHEGCGNNLGLLRMDGTRFSVSSLNVSAQDFTRVAPVSPIVPAGTDFLPFDLTQTDILADLDAAGVLPYTPEASAILAQKNAENPQLIADYKAWVDSSGYATRDRFYVAGYRGGVEVARQDYGDTGGQTQLALSGFTDLDEITFGFHGENFLWDHYYFDNGGVAVLGAGQTWCDNACEMINIFGFDYALAGGSKPDLTGSVSSVPLPSGVWLMGLALGLLGWGARRSD